MAEAYQKFGLSCPSGGSFYICQNNATEFIGCCTTNPCTAANGGRCPQSNLRASSFSADTYTDLPRQDCDDERSIQIWYTCKFNKPPFMGCCASNPCANGLCPPSDLRPAKLSGDSELRALFLSPSPTAGGAASATTSAAPATATTAGLSRSAVAGICAGVAAVVLIIVGFIMYKYGWNARRKRDTEEKAAPPSLALNNSAMGPPPGQPSPGLAVADQQYRDSYLSGVTVFSHGSPRPDQYSPPPHDTKKLSFQSYGHYTSIPSGPDHYSSHPAHAAVPVELPLSYPAVQELPADFHTINYNAQRDSGTLGLSPEPPSSRHSNSPTVTPMSSPRLAEESTFRQAQSPEHLRTMSAGGGRSTGGYYYTPTRAGQTYQGS